MSDDGRDNVIVLSPVEREPEPVILGPDGKPFSVEKADVSPRDFAEDAIHGFNAYLDSLYGVSRDPAKRAEEPLKNHPWLLAAAMIRAQNFAQAPLYVWRETEAEQDRRRDAAVAKGLVKHRTHWVPGRGDRRTAVERHLTKQANPQRFRAGRMTAMERDFDNEWWRLLKRPNEFMTLSSLLQITSLWLSLRGESIWIGINQDDTPVLPGEVPDEIWPVSPDLLKPMWDRGANRQVGWWFVGKRGVPKGSFYGSGAQRIPLMLSEVVQFKYPNPFDPHRGLNPIAAAAAGINMDMLADEHNRATISNGAEPGGLFTYRGNLKAGERDAFEAQINKRHAGVHNRNRHLVLGGLWEYKPTSLKPAEMQYMESKKWTREAVFSIMRVPKVVAGVTENADFATGIAQDRNLWDKSLIPDGCIVEETLDATLFGQEPDTSVIAFDYSGVEALRHGLDDQVETANKLMKLEAHMPPRVAFDMVGLTEVPEYEGVDVCIVPGMSALPVSEVLNPTVPVPGQPGPEGDPSTPPDEKPPGDNSDGDRTPQGDGDGGGEEPAPKGEPGKVGDVTVDESGVEWTTVEIIAAKSRRERKNARLWRRFVAVQSRSEGLMRRNWRRWVREERTLQLAQFDAVAGEDRRARSTKAIDVSIVLLNLLESQERIKREFRPSYSSTLEATHELVVDEVGVPIFEIDNPSIMESFSRRIGLLANGPPITIQRLLGTTLAQGIANGETVQTLRQRVAEVFDVQLGTAKTLTVARTESASFMNDARYQMFGLQQVPDLEWVTAGDEGVRATHVFFGSVGPQPVGTNYLDLEGYPGTSRGVLEYPGDSRADAEERISCRCVQVVPS